MPLRPTFPAYALAAITTASLLSGTASAAPAEVAACPLLTTDEVAAALGEPLVAAEQDPMGGGEKQGRMTTCIWTPANSGLGPTMSLILWSWPPGSPGAARFIEAFRIVAEDYPDLPTPESVAIGDEALWDGTGMHVRKGDMSFSLSTSLNALGRHARRKGQDADPRRHRRRTAVTANPSPASARPQASA
jgi:hypothetical protein